MNYDFDPVASDPSDANTNSTTLFSDDTDDLSRRSTNPEMGMSTHQEDEAPEVWHLKISVQSGSKISFLQMNTHFL